MANEDKGSKPGRNQPQDKPRFSQQQYDFLKKCSEKGKEGIKEWNKWREENSYEEIWLQKADLEEAYLENANLWKAHLEHAYLGMAHLENAILEDAHLADYPGVGNRIAEAPASDGKGFGETVDEDQVVKIIVRQTAGMLTLINVVMVNLIRENEDPFLIRGVQKMFKTFSR